MTETKPILAITKATLSRGVLEARCAQILPGKSQKCLAWNKLRVDWAMWFSLWRVGSHSSAITRRALSAPSQMRNPGLSELNRKALERKEVVA